MIRSLDSTSARLLSSGQVISTISSVLKELLENALDAGSATVDIFVTEFGLGSIVVCDDGSGIPLAAAAPCKPNADEEREGDDKKKCFLLSSRASSKCPVMLQETNGRSLSCSSAPSRQLSASSVQGDMCRTLGFRGEALHSLAHTSSLIILTRRSNEDDDGHIRRLTYSPSLNETSVETIPISAAPMCSSWWAGRESGTIVIVKELFAMLPVRRKELTKNCKKQLANAVLLVKQYALTNPSVRLLVRHQEERSCAAVGNAVSVASSSLLSTSGSGDLQRSLADAYGSRVLGGMDPVDWALERCRVRGYMSRVGHGRATNDVQVIAMNGRLVDLPKIGKAIADAFAQSHPSAAQRTCPAFFLVLASFEHGDEDALSVTGNDQNDKMKQGMHYDVNLAPDKRQVLVENEDELVREVFASAKRSFSLSSDSTLLTQQKCTASSQRSFAASSSLADRIGTINAVPFTPVVVRPLADPVQLSASCRVDQTSERKFYPAAAVIKDEPNATAGMPDRSAEATAKCTACDCSVISAVNEAHDLQDSSQLYVTPSRAAPGAAESTLRDTPLPIADDYPQLTDDGEFAGPSYFRPVKTLMQFVSLAEMALQPLPRPVSDRVNADDDDEECAEHSETEDAPPRKRGRVDDSCARKANVSTKQIKKKKRTDKRAKPLGQQSDKDLDACLSKAAFATMTIYGQFNHGFIVASHEDMLFVIDQHAADEKYNYETLVVKYQAKPQPLVRPFPLTMDPHEAQVTLEHKEELAAQGFVVTAPPRSQDEGVGESLETSSFAVVHVRSVPVLAYDTVTPQDLLELTQQLLQYGSIVKPLRAVWHSLATKACRSSIMIGTALDKRTLTTIVRHMATMSQPWNCPHGRPTLRHVGYISQY